MLAKDIEYNSYSIRVQQQTPFVNQTYVIFVSFILQGPPFASKPRHVTLAPSRIDAALIEGQSADGSTKKRAGGVQLARRSGPFQWA